MACIQYMCTHTHLQWSLLFLGLSIMYNNIKPVLGNINLQCDKFIKKL